MSRIFTTVSKPSRTPAITARIRSGPRRQDQAERDDHEAFDRDAKEGTRVEAVELVGADEREPDEQRREDGREPGGGGAHPRSAPSARGLIRVARWGFGRVVDPIRVRWLTGDAHSDTPTTGRTSAGMITIRRGSTVRRVVWIRPCCHSHHTSRPNDSASRTRASMSAATVAG